MKNITFVLSLSIGFFVACNTKKAQNFTPENVQKLTASIELKAEIEKWKNKLLSQKVLGSPCDFDSISGKKAHIWQTQNPNQADGLPKSDIEISTSNADFDGDSLSDLLLSFVATNCSGHNGGTPTFAKIIFANGTSNDTIMDEIKKAIVSNYNKKREIDKKLKEITDSYLRENITISYSNNVLLGQSSLYAKEVAHCCPSYTINYTYQVRSKVMDIKIVENRP